MESPVDPTLVESLGLMVSSSILLIGVIAGLLLLFSVLRFSFSSRDNQRRGQHASIGGPRDRSNFHTSDGDQPNSRSRDRRKRLNGVVIALAGIFVTLAGSVVLAALVLV